MSVITRENIYRVTCDKYLYIRNITNKYTKQKSNIRISSIQLSAFSDSPRTSEASNIVRLSFCAVWVHTLPWQVRAAGNPWFG